MAKSVITPEEGDELRRLYAEWEALQQDCFRAIASGGMDNPDFMEAEQKLSAVIRRTKEILGTSGQHWMS